ncbi:conserved protein of unknown function [Candidatus Methylomirabilis oxygeniifera]|uniref:Uncharacterized protein n=1 Tax=Methylomirabilis oxygeniifera TaxID=671143 RepID=D5MFL4_METO1|nr:conserved protein of unknown function [Candidatus Methylomirabilis oxyfera]
MLTQAQRLQEFLIENLARMHRRQFPASHNYYLLVIVNNLNLVGVVAPPIKADSPLIINPDRVLPGPIASQLFKPIPRRGAKIPKRASRC